MKSVFRIILIVLITLLLSFGCKIRRVSDGKPPRDGVMTKTRKEITGEIMSVEEEYKEGLLVSETVRYADSTIASERFLRVLDRPTDSMRSYYRNGRLQFLLVSNDTDRIYMKGYFEDGALQIVGDTSSTIEYYENGNKKFSSLMRRRQIYQVNEWYQNGKLREMSEWWNDKRNGKRIAWDSTGKLVTNELYKDGVKIR